jgi:hypothetical protein
MARSKSNGDDRLEEAMRSLAQAQATLIQANATLVQNQAAFQARIAEIDARNAETNREMIELKREVAETNRINSERFARIEALLLEHNRILLALPDAIREKIGFKSPATSPKE